MISGKRSFLLTLLFIILPFVLMGCQAVEKSVYSHQQRADSAESLFLDMFEKDPVLKLLGKSFNEIKQLKGEPDEAGYSGWLGPHYGVLTVAKVVSGDIGDMILPKLLSA